MENANSARQRAANWIDGRNLKFAPEKTEIILMTIKRNIQPIIIFKIE